MVQKKKESIEDGLNFIAISLNSNEIIDGPGNLKLITESVIEAKKEMPGYDCVVAQIILEAETRIDMKPYGEV